MKLSILIPTITKRQIMLARLMRILQPQLTDETELIIDCDDGERTIGKKRNDLMAKAKGDYIVFIDDDDLITDNYVSELMRGISTGLDVVCVNAIHTTDGYLPRLVIDLPYQEWKEAHDIYLRGVQWRDAVKREIAISVPYPDIRFGEDHAWTVAIEATKIIKTWLPATEPTYFHEFVSAK